MCQVKEKLFIFFRPRIVEAQYGVHVPCNAQTYALRVAHLAKIKLGNVVIHAPKIIEGNTAKIAWLRMT
jgi:hypothetical protein